MQHLKILLEKFFSSGSNAKQKSSLIFLQPLHNDLPSKTTHDGIFIRCATNDDKKLQKTLNSSLSKTSMKISFVQQTNTGEGFKNLSNPLLVSTKNRIFYK